MSTGNHYLIKNVLPDKPEREYSVNSLMSVLYLIFVLTGIILFKSYADVNTLWLSVSLCLFPFLIFGVYLFSGRWDTVLKIIGIPALLFFYFYGNKSLYYTLPVLGGALMAPVIQVAKEWERFVILRLGKFQKVKGPGLFFMIPFIDTVTEIVDMRIRVTDFAAETTLTKDSVPVTVDALAFWLVWDAEKAVLEVESYLDAVVLSSQTALREAVSSNNLSVLLENSNEIREVIRREVDRKTTEWGITIQRIEIQEIKVPEHLQELLSKTAQAEREKNARILLGEAEVALAKKYTEASGIYADDEKAIRLRSMSIINEGLKNGNSMILPESVVTELGREGELGLKALTELRSEKKI